MPQLYSKLSASQELRKMLELGRTDERNDLARLSDAELIQQMADQAKQLGIEINLNYSFARRIGQRRQFTSEQFFRRKVRRIGIGPSVSPFGAALN